jgi:hypothetical protein
MSTQLVPLTGINLPAHLRKTPEQARAVAAELAGGVTASFPIISYRGKVWRVRKGGQEVSFLDANQDPVQSIELVFVKSNKLPSKTYYEKKYEEGDTESPVCWSSDGIRPDAAVTKKQNPVCASCKWNAWGSRITEAGKKGRACSDVRRMAVVFADELARKGTDAHLFLMRVPPASLNPLKDYAEKVLGPAGIEYFSLVTRVGFDTQVAYPQLTFRAAVLNNQPRFLTEAEYEAVQKLRESDEATRMLSEEPDYAGAGNTGAEDAAGKDPAQNEASAPAPAPTNGAAKAARPQPVAEEDVPIVVATPDEGEEDEEGDVAAVPAAVVNVPPPVVAAPNPLVRKPRKPRAPAPAAVEAGQVATPPAATPAAPSPAAKAPGGFDDLLDQLLK